MSSASYLRADVVRLTSLMFKLGQVLLKIAVNRTTAFPQSIFLLHTPDTCGGYMGEVARQTLDRFWNIATTPNTFARRGEKPVSISIYFH